MLRNSLTCLFLLITLSFCRVPADDKVVFPKFPQQSSNQYSGFLTSSSGQQNYHYVFFESQGKPATDPIVLWIQGGPGASSLYGLLKEIGPVIINEYDEKAQIFQSDGYGWNSNANLLIIDQPGVGFSTNTDEDYVYNDQITAQSTYEALQIWFGIFQEYKSNNFYLAGESYAGIQIPYLAHEIINNNNQTPTQNVKINLKGIMMGNAKINTDSDLAINSLNQYMMDRNFLDVKSKYAFNNQCLQYPSSYNCQQALQKFLKIVQNLNPYNVYGYCYNDNGASSKLSFTPWSAFDKLYKNIKSTYTQCLKVSDLENYLNDASVQAALRLSGTFQFINQNVYESYDISETGSYGLFKSIKQAGVNILLYSGDMDASVSIQETLNSLSLMNLIEEKEWGPVADSTNAIYGWTVEYDLLDLLIVRAAGLNVPSDQRSAAFIMLNDFIKSNLILKN